MAIFCHKCGTQAKDDESVFCNRCGTKYIQNIPGKKDDACPNCGTKILDKQSVFCNKCGFQVSATLPAQPPTNQPTSTPIKPTNQPNFQQNTRPKKPRINLGLVFVGAGVLLFIVLIVMVISGISGNYNSSFSKDVIITQDLSSMALTINDFPTGWKANEPKITETTYSRNFLKQEGLEASVVYFTMWKFNSTDEAKAEFNSKKAKITSVKVEPVNLGNEGFGYVDVKTTVIVFRTGNIITSTTYGLGSYVGVSLSTLSLSDSQQYANKVANRIR